MNILIVSTFFPPLNSIASHRPYSWAKWWSRAGHNVTVLTTTKLPSHVDINVSHEGIEVIDVDIPFITKRQRNRREAQSNNKDNGCDGNRKSQSSVTSWLMLKLSEKGVFNSTRFPDLSELWVGKAREKVLERKWDIVVTTGGPYTVHKVGYDIKASSPETKWILDWRDLWTDNHIFKGLPLIRWYENYLERKFHDSADLISTVSDPLARVIQRKTNTKTVTIYNGIDEEDFLSLDPQRFFPADSILRIVYAGTIYKDLRDPTPLFQAIAELKDLNLVGPEHLQIYFAGNKSNVSELADDFGLNKFFTHLGLVSREESLRMQRDADILLFLETEIPGVDGILTGKLFEYLHLRKFVLGIGITQKSETGRLIEKYSPGVACGNSVELIKEHLLKLLRFSDLEQNSTKFIDYSNLNMFSRKVGAEKLLVELFKND